MSKVNTDAYLEFVDAVTSEQSKDFEEFVYRLQELEGQEFPSERLLTAAVGMSAEAGEFTEIVELGDIMWYVAQACMGLNISLDDIIEMNVDKLKSRYPGGEFSVKHSEVRKEGDL
jgi:NTP pyrophosphatase (non-canonical NTP hydrolase)